ncbi:MAG: EF-P lysine aminoacylase GenX [Planctomycetales bacterium]|nr:EF-P lysine aminoacylase GenX [Planctomycetales bacterium]
MIPPTVVPDFLPAASPEMLATRASLLRRLRTFFDSRGFLEVETPLLSHDVVVDRHLDPLSVTLSPDPREPEVGPKLWLQTSPEFAMKRLLVTGKDQLRSIYQITRAFRGGEIGPLHNPEFTMVEWYRVNDDYAAGMQLLADLAEEMLGLGTPERLTYREAFIRFAKVDPFEPTSAADHDLQLDLQLTQKVEPHLGQSRPTILYDYPASQSALARVREGNPPVAERFELYVRGIELANGYHELLDPAILRERNRLNNALRTSDGKQPLPEESLLLAAMDHGLPACSGCALGFDRLVMAATGAKTIQEVLAFPISRA